MKSNPVVVLLSTYNGSQFLKEQLDSLYNQSYKDFTVIARDDGSSDDTLDILQSYNVEIIQNDQNVGAKKSFSELLEYALKNGFEYFMFCDQDDVWDENKIEKTLARMQEAQEQNPNTPILVHTNLKVVDEDLNTLGGSFMSLQGLHPKYDSLNRLLIQNVVTGCTVMINRELAKLCLPVPQEAIMHDWWIALVASAFGKIIYIDETTISYRQHSSNTLGAIQFNAEYIQKQLFKSDLLSENIRQTEIFLERYQESLDENTIEILENFAKIATKPFYEKRKIILKYKLFKNGFIRNVGLFLKI